MAVSRKTAAKPGRAKPSKAKSADAKLAAQPQALGEYSAKRTFAVTPEPPPAQGSGSGPLLFVVQQHSARRMHWDFRIELDGVLVSWAVPKGPSLNPADKRMAIHVEDHPFDYASFEGVIPPKQYGAGEVIIWDCGVYSPDEDDATWFHDRDHAQRLVREGIAQGKLSIFLRGEKLKGSFALVRTADQKSWLLIKHKDRFAQAIDITQQTRSIVSGVSVEDLKRLPAQERLNATSLKPTGPAEPLPRKLSPMLAEQGDGPFTDPRWLYEPKLDGYRILAFIEGTGVRLCSRRGLDLTAQFPNVVAELSQQAVRGMVLDGEIIAFGPNGKPSFNALQNRAQLKTEREIAQAERKSPCILYVFDILHFAGINVRGAPYVARRRYLAQCLLPGPHVQIVHADEDGEALYPAALAAGFEGIVAKRKDSPYQPGRRSPHWEKIKSSSTADLVVGGYTKGNRSREPLGALLLGYWEGDKLRFAGHVGSGFDGESIEQVKQRVEVFKTSRCPFTEKPPLNNPTTWVKPELVAEVKYLQLLETGILRAPVFLRLRDDIDPKQVHRPGAQPVLARAAPSRPASEVDRVLQQLDTRESTLMLEVGAARFKLTNLDKLYWPAEPSLKQPALTKRDLLRYLTRVSALMIPHLADRPLTMIRMPEGIHGERFFQKHWEHKVPEFVESVRLYSGSKDEQQEYLLCNNLATLLWVAQAGTLEFHVWHSRARPGPDAVTQSTDYASSLEALESSVLNYPDYLVFDIDPYIYSGKEAPGEEPELNTVAFEKGKEVAFWLRELLNSMSLEPIVKTSGKTGLHVFVPIERTIDFTTARHVCEAVGRHLLRSHPRDITMEWTVGKRTGKIFIDYNMNVRSKTLNSAYSPRGVPGAPVSMPLTWAELEKAHPMDFRIPNVMRRLERAGDVWRDALRAKQSLTEALERAPA
jgi:bifunctional non-homologous end joining protein LigD